MGLIAAVTAGAAWIYYPWPEKVVESAIVGKPLFESYDTSSVRMIRISGYDDNKNEVDRILVRRKGQKWVIPSKREYVASNVAQYTAAVNCLNAREVLEERTSNQQDYLEYGVIDPKDADSAANTDAIGTKIILEDRQGRMIANLIVGKPVSDNARETKHFVRVPGQPSVYVCEFDRRATQTDFRAWVDPNLFKLTQEIALNDIVVENYRIDPKSLGSGPQKNYRANLKVGRQKLDLATMEIGGGAGEWRRVGFTEQMSTQLQSVAAQLFSIRFSNVQKKDPKVADLLTSQKEGAGRDKFKWLESYGFVNTGYDRSCYQYDGVGGEVSLTTADGVVVSMYIGKIAERAEGELQLSRYAMFVAGVDPSVYPEPKKPQATDDEEQSKKDEKTYLRLVEERNGKIKNAGIRASELNQQYADWLFMVPENVIENLRPEIDVSTAAPLKAPAVEKKMDDSDSKSTQTKSEALGSDNESKDESDKEESGNVEKNESKKD